MPVSEREKIHYELLEALYKARKQVEYLEAALAHNAAYLGTGVEREDFSSAPVNADPDALPEEVMRYLGLTGREEDVSDFLGREGDDASRPRLGEDAPDAIRPRTEPRIGHLVGQLAFGHPDDALVLPGPKGGMAPLPEESMPESAEDPPAALQPPAGERPAEAVPTARHTAAHGRGDEAGPAQSHRSASQSEAPRDRRPDEEDRLPSLDILVADDDAVSRFTLRTLLQRAGHRAVCVENGHEALQALQLRPFSCLVTDLAMPVMDGIELVKRVRSGNAAGIVPHAGVLRLLGFDPESSPSLLPLPIHMPIIALSGSTEDAQGRPLWTRGVDAYLSKPLNMQLLVEALFRVVGPSGEGRHGAS